MNTGHLLCASSLLTVMTSGIAIGQDAGLGGAANSDRSTIAEIVVTAQKRAENAQDVPIAISAFTANALRERAVADVSSLSNIAPNVTLDAGTPFSGSSSVLSAYVRGIGQNDFAANLDPGVGVYLDGVYLARTVGANLNLPDVERIEVLTLAPLRTNSRRITSSPHGATMLRMMLSTMRSRSKACTMLSNWKTGRWYKRFRKRWVRQTSSNSTRY